MIEVMAAVLGIVSENMASIILYSRPVSGSLLDNWKDQNWLGTFAAYILNGYKKQQKILVG